MHAVGRVALECFGLASAFEALGHTFKLRTGPLPRRGLVWVLAGLAVAVVAMVAARSF